MHAGATRAAGVVNRGVARTNRRDSRNTLAGRQGVNEQVVSRGRRASQQGSVRNGPTSLGAVCVFLKKLVFPDGRLVHAACAAFGEAFAHVLGVWVPAGACAGADTAAGSVRHEARRRTGGRRLAWQGQRYPWEIGGGELRPDLGILFVRRRRLTTALLARPVPEPRVRVAHSGRG